jgi:hypothetical protein
MFVAIISLQIPCAQNHTVHQCTSLALLQCSIKSTHYSRYLRTHTTNTTGPTLYSPHSSAMNDNQNYFVTRSTSRVLSEPGGKSSTGYLFGGGGGCGSSRTTTTTTTMPAAATSSASATSCATPNRHGNTNSGNSTASPVRNAMTNAATNSSPMPNSNDITATTPNKKGEESAISAAARIKQKNEAQTFSLFGGGGTTTSTSSTSHSNAPQPLSSNAYASSSTTNSYNVLTDRPTSRVVSV